MTPLVDVSLRACLIVIVGLAASAALRRKSAALRHLVLATSILAAGAASPLGVWLPAWDVRWPAMSSLASASLPASPIPATGTPTATPAAAATSTPGIAASVTQPADSSLSLMTLAFFVWIAGLAASLGLLLTGIARLVFLERRARRLVDGPLVHAMREVAAELGVQRAIALVQTDTDDVLATWGTWRPSILLPRHAADWTPDRLRIVLTHEIAHIRRNDWLVQLAADVVRAAFWFNPLFWVACARLRRDSEQACDDRVLDAGVTADRYATHLLALARRARRPAHRLASAVPMARSSTLERRIAAMLNPDVNRRALSTRALIVCAGLVAVVAVPIAALRGAQTSPLPLTGVIYDSTGAVIPAVEVSVEDEQQNKLKSGSTDGSGRFTFDAIAPGKYVLVAELPGFKALRQPMDLRQAADWRRVATLQVGTLKETVSIQAQRPSKSRPSAGSGVAPSPVRVGGNIKAPTKITDVRAVYPASMREAELEGQVPLEAIISKEGTVQSVRVLSAQVHPDFVKSAVDAVQQWRFSPTLLNGAPVEVMMNVTLNFSLSDQ